MLDYPVANEQQVISASPPPHSREAEEALLGAVFINPETYREVTEKIGAGDFYIHRNRWIWDAFKTLVEAKTPIDLLTVSDLLNGQGKLQELGGSAYLTSLVNQAPVSYNAPYYAEIVRNCAISRRMIMAANEIAKLGYDGVLPMEQRLGLAEKQWQAVRKDGDSRSRLLGMKELLSNAYDRINAITKLGRPPGMISNLIDLDKILHGFKKGRYYLIAGRPGDGKTSLLLTLARNFMKYEGKSVLYISIEMQENSDFDDPISGGELSERLLGMEANIDTTSISDGRLQDTDWPLYTNAIEHMQNWRFTVDDDSGVTPDQMMARAWKVKGEIGLDVVIVDYIQIQETPTGERFGTRAEHSSQKDYFAAHVLRLLLIQP